MSKIFLLLLLVPNFVSAATICFKGKMPGEIIDQVCFDKEQVEGLKVIGEHGSESLIEVKFLNVPNPLIIISDLKFIQRKLK